MKYLLAVDGSEESLNATRALEALSPGKELTLLHVVNVPGVPYPAIGAGIAKDLTLTVQKGLKDEGERLLNQAESLLPLNHGQLTKKLEEGVPAEGILKVSKEQQPDLLLIGDRGLGQIREQLLGSVSHRVMTHATCSTLIVKKPLRAVKHVLMPLETPEDGESVMRFFQKTPFQETCSVTLLHVIPFGDPVWPVGAMITPEFRNEMVAQGEQFTHHVADELDKLGHHTTCEVLTGAPSRVILDQAKQREVDVIIMRTHSKSGISRFLLGSVSHAVVHQADCSILLVRE